MTEPFPQAPSDSKGPFEHPPPSPALRPWQTAPHQDLPFTTTQPAPLPRSMSTATATRPALSCRRRRGTLSTPFAGRLGGNQEFTVDRSDPENESLLKKVPDAAPNLTLKEAFDLGGFRELGLYKPALIEFVGTMVFVYSSAWNSLSPNIPPPLPSETLGPFNRVYFIGPLVSNTINAIILALLIFSFGAISGAHFNPLITLGTFFARLTTFPRLVLYLSAQISGAALAGLLLRASANTRDFRCGGCYLFTEQGTPVSSAFTIEVVSDILLLFLAFGVGLDPRQREVFGPSLGPIFVGLAVGSVALLTAYTLPGYGGAGLNAARCFGVYVGSRFPGWHWVHWVAPFVAGIFHGLVYFLVPPGEPVRSDTDKIGRTVEKIGRQDKEDGRQTV